MIEMSGQYAVSSTCRDYWHAVGMAIKKAGLPFPESVEKCDALLKERPDIALEVSIESFRLAGCPLSDEQIEIARKKEKSWLQLRSE